MRKGARWYSMEMAGVVTHTGAKIIQHALWLVNGVGIPLELDTDGIWCCLPTSFPENLKFTSSQPGKEKGYVMNYPCTVLNKIVVENFSNHQYQVRDPPMQCNGRQPCCSRSRTSHRLWGSKNSSWRRTLGMHDKDVLVRRVSLH
jgi:DNA polymerase epsilon subunit 1